MTEIEECQKTVHEPGRGFFSHKCRRPVKGNLKNGTPACGIHLAAERRRAQNDADYRAKQAASKKARADVQVIIDRLTALGITASATFDGRTFTYDGGIRIDNPQALMVLLGGAVSG